MASWHNSVIARYVALSLIAAVLPLLTIGALYDRYSSDLLERLTGERLERRLTVMSSRLSAFMARELYQLQTLAEYPFLASLLTPMPRDGIDSGLQNLVEFEANQPDLYGILLFSSNGTMVRAVPGQAASGAPYWGSKTFSLEGFPRVRAASAEIVGPIPPGDGRSGSLVLLHELRQRGQAGQSGGKIGLHLRLASLTELLGAEDEAGVFRPLLLTPGGAYSNVGLPVTRPLNLIQGAEIMPGWQPALAVEQHRLAAPLRTVRYALLGGVLAVVALLTWLFLSLLDRIRSRVGLLMDGASAVANGDLSWRIESKGEDEIDKLGQAFNTMAERLRKMLRATIDVEKMAVLGQFATSVAHEVRNPLAAIKTSAQVLLPHEQDDDRRNILCGMVEEIDRLEDNVNDLLNFARPRDAKVEIVAVKEIIDSLSELITRPARDARVEVECVLEGDDLAVRADAGHIRQILMNLALNALQAMPQGGHLRLHAGVRGKNAILQVADTGVGIPPELIPKITEPFFTTRPTGTGLGLAITRQLVEMNGGQLDFSSRPGEGTIATVNLPLAKGT